MAPQFVQPREPKEVEENRSRGLRGTSYPGYAERGVVSPEGLHPAAAGMAAGLGYNPFRVAGHWRGSVSQGSSFLATLGCKMESLGIPGDGQMKRDRDIDGQPIAPGDAGLRPGFISESSARRA